MSTVVPSGVPSGPSAPRPAGALLRALGSQSAIAAVVATVLVLGVAVRLRQYGGRPSYWYDEANVLLAAFNRSVSDLASPSMWPATVAPPGHLWILRGVYLAGGSSELAMRAPAVFASLLSVVVMFPLARRLVGPPAWPWAGAFCAISFHGMVHACEAKPYAGDLLVTELVLLAALPALAPDGASPRPRSAAALVAAAVLAPWVSFPSLFVLGAASLALLLHAIRTGAGWRAWVAVTVPVLAYGAFLRALTLRNPDRAALHAHFAACFPHDASLSAAALSLARQVVHVGDYATTGMGVPLLVLAALGVARLRARSGARAVLLAGPIVLAALAGVWHLYPLCDRLTFFAAPCIWLLAAAGIGAVAVRLGRRRAWIVVGLGVFLLLPDTERMARKLGRVDPRIGFRDAFEYVRARWQPGDTLWLANPEMFELYYRQRDNVLGPTTPPAAVDEAIRRGRLWVIDHLPAPGRPSLHVATAGLRDGADHRTVVGKLDVLLFSGPTPNR